MLCAWQCSRPTSPSRSQHLHTFRQVAEWRLWEWATSSQIWRHCCQLGTPRPPHNPPLSLLARAQEVDNTKGLLLCTKHIHHASSCQQTRRERQGTMEPIRWYRPHIPAGGFGSGLLLSLIKDLPSWNHSPTPQSSFSVVCVCVCVWLGKAEVCVGRTPNASCSLHLPLQHGTYCMQDGPCSMHHDIPGVMPTAIKHYAACIEQHRAYFK